MHDTWRLGRAEVCERFLKHLSNIVEDRPRENVPDNDPDFNVPCQCGGDNRSSNCLWIALDGWIQSGDLLLNVDGRNAISVKCRGMRPNAWHCGEGGLRTRTHDYIRHGTICLLSAMSCADGKLIDRTEQQPTHV